MRKKLYLVLILVLALVVGWRVFTFVNDDDEDEDIPASTATSTTERTWPEYRTVEDIPIYPGARDREAFHSNAPIPATNQYRKIGWLFLSTDADVDEVNSFYADTMPDHGWEASAKMSQPDVTWTFWQTMPDLETGAFIGLSPEGSQTVIWIWRGEGYIPPPPPET